MSWTPVTLEDGDQSSVADIADDNEHIWVITFDGVGDDFLIYGSPVDRDDWTRAPLSFALNAGPVTSFSIALHGGHGWIAENDRGVVTGASLDDNIWTAWTPPCNGATGFYDDESLAAISLEYVVALCPPDLAANALPPTAVYASTDAGTRFQKVTTSVPSRTTGLAASPSGALFANDGQGMLASFNAGATWQTVIDSASSTFPYPPGTGITFVTSAVGYATMPSGELFKTVDGGHSWQSAGLPST